MAAPAPPQDQAKPMPIPAPQQSPHVINEQEDQSSSCSSDSSTSTSSLASIATVRPSSREQQASTTHWTSYFDQELYLPHETSTHKATYHVHLTPPTDPKTGPLFICHHGAGASSLSFALFAHHLRQTLPTAGILSLSARNHGSTVLDPTTSLPIHDYTLPTLATDALTMISLTATSQSWPSIPPCILIGHSLGGAIVTSLATTHFRSFNSNLVGYAVLDVVEGSAIEALGHMKTYLASRPSSFANIEEAIQWHIRSRTLRSPQSADISVPSLLIPDSTNSDRLVWHTDLSLMSSFWPDWFTGMSSSFLTGRGAKLLILAGTDRLDKELMIGQMQGKFQLVVLPEAGHFLHEDRAEKVAGLVAEFWKRNDRSAMVLPPKVSELLAMGKKV
ncbi:unnamed protein product [Zymoseptoria tritici ST99CH_1A5]|uniref:Protein phosphatase methylesterase 1 n=1 Tax=Zymoseptoria tritici ST99CH_1A5 TaxID=1276529 RepID=A0A1Y6LM75_ZYMTR|nr:unnamed protein product [Zymoseptoria tritici ST99CH_1A5]